MAFWWQRPTAVHRWQGIRSPNDFALNQCVYLLWFPSDGEASVRNGCIADLAKIGSHPEPRRNPVKTVRNAVCYSEERQSHFLRSNMKQGRLSLETL